MLKAQASINVILAVAHDNDIQHLTTACQKLAKMPKPLFDKMIQIIYETSAEYELER